jgi:aspartate aminotransferase
MLGDTGVATLPGSAFGRPVEELTFRLSYVDFDGAAALQASAVTPGDALDPAFLGRYCGRVLTAFDRMTDFLARQPAQATAS